MHTFFANHPVSHAVLLNALLTMVGSALYIAISTLVDIVSTPSDFWSMDGHTYQRWSVVPMSGHLDEALLDTDTGTVVCP